MVEATAMKPAQPNAGWRFRLGLIVLVVGWLSPLLFGGLGPDGAHHFPVFLYPKFIVSALGM
jgi:hypothetical protein